MPYHHGHLRDALVEAALATARADGPDAVVLRAATRAAGVSPNAAYRHFADRDELLWAVGDLCRDRLADLMRRRQAEVPAGPDPAEVAIGRLMAAGRAYVEFAVTEPGWFRTAFDPVKAPPGSMDELPAPYAILVAALDDMVVAGAMPAERRPGAEYPAWAAVHGLSTLLVEGALRELPAAERDAAVEKVLETIARGL